MKLLRKIPTLTGFLAFYLKELLLANLRVAHDALTPTHHMRPAILAVPLQARTDFEILLLADLISMTPGSLSLEVSPDRRTLYVHVMYAVDPDGIRHHIQTSLERRVLDLLR